ncbi:hypothetical protein BH24PSE2_BH24PSE2_24040 [soil metagenome]
MRRRLLAGIAVLVALGLLAPGLVGVLAQNRHEQRLEETIGAAPWLRITAEDFDRGWFRSRARYRVELGEALQKNPAPAAGTRRADAPALLIDSRLGHGPFALGTGLVLARIESQLTIVGADHSPVTLPAPVITRIDLDGGGTAQYSGGPVRVETDGRRIHLTGAEIAARFDPEHLIVRGRLAALTAVDAHGRFEAAPLKFSVAHDVGDGGSSAYNVELQIPHAELTGREARLSFSDLRFSHAETQSADRIAAAIAIRVEELQVGERTLGPAVLRLQATDLDAVALDRLATANRDAESSEPGAALMALVASGASASIDPLRVNTPDGEVSVTARFEFAEHPANGGSALLGPGFSGALRLEVPQAIAAAAAAARPQFELWLQTLLDLGFVEAEQDRYRLNAEYRNGLLTVNGIPLPFPFGGTAAGESL